MNACLERHMIELTQALLTARMAGKDGEYGQLKDALAELIRVSTRTYLVAEKLHRSQQEQ